MSSETLNIEQPSQYELDKAYEEYVDKAIAEGEADIKEKKTKPYSEIKKEIIEKYNL